MRVLRSLLALVIFAATATTASAAVRYASPAGGGSAPCTNAALPCSLNGAVASALATDRVLLAGGDYSFTALSVNAAISIEGPQGGAPAELHYTGPSALGGINFNASNAALRGLIVDGTTDGGTALVGTNFGLTGIVLDRLDVRNAGEGFAVAGNDLTLRDSALVSMTTNGVAAAVTGTVTGCTIIADQGLASRALSASTSFDATASVVVRNTILRGGLTDAEASDDDGAGPNTASIDIDYAAYDPGQVIATNVNGVVILGIYNVNAAGTLLPAVGGGPGIHQGAGSNTINAGTEAAPAIGTLDFEGDPRIIGSAPDIGADEYVPAPTATTTAASAVTQTTATLNASINPNGRAVSYFFDFGTTASYGTTTTVGSIGGFTTAQSGTATLSGLQPGTTYHLRVTATRAPDSVQGGDVTFTTLATPTPPAPPGPPPADRTAPSVSGLSLTPASVATGRSASLALRVSEAGTIKVTVDRLVPGRKRGAKCLTTARTGKRCTKAVRTGSVSGSAVANVKTTVKVPTRLIRRKGTYRITVVVTDSAGNATRPLVKTLRVR
jgi:hypothetical protein